MLQACPTFKKHTLRLGLKILSTKSNIFSVANITLRKYGTSVVTTLQRIRYFKFIGFLHKAIISSDQYRLSLPVAIPLCLCAVGWVGYVNKTTGSDTRD
jgi:hypothetical protein